MAACHENAAETCLLATLLGPKAPHARQQCDFTQLAKAVAWCLKHANETGCGAEVIHGVNSGGTVVWKHKGRKGRPDRRRTEEANNHTLQWTGPAVRPS